MLTVTSNKNNIKMKAIENPQVGEIWWAKIPNAIGHQQGGTHPVLIYSNNIFNNGGLTNAYTITSQIQKRSPVHVFVKKDNANNLEEDSVIQIENPWQLNRFQLTKKIGTLSLSNQIEVAQKMTIQCPMLNLLQLVRA